eukprot:5166509-Alexandrium_andersonii.AAC.1
MVATRQEVGKAAGGLACAALACLLSARRATAWSGHESVMVLPYICRKSAHASTQTLDMLLRCISCGGGKAT